MNNTGKQQSGRFKNIPLVGKSQKMCFFNIQIVWILTGLCIISPVHAAGYDTTVCDVTTRSFSIVWASNEPVIDATVRVYADPDGLNEQTWNFTENLVSAIVPKAHDQGLVKVEIMGVASDTQLYVQTETIGINGTVFYPEVPPYIPVRTALSTKKVTSSDTPVVNDLITHEVLAPDGVTPTEGTLLLASVPAISDYPLCEFVGDRIQEPAAAVDLNNFFEAATGINAELVAGETLRLTEYRGLLCNSDDQALVRFRRVPVHEENPSIIEFEPAGGCFNGADFNCDSCVDPIDFNEFLIKFGLSNDPPDCRFNTDYDLSGDNNIDPIDFNELLMVFGVCEGG